VVRSSDGRSARPPRGVVLRSTAQYSAVRPHQSHRFGFAPLDSRKAAVSNAKLFVA
jgi:hypothetical protein